MITRLGKYEIRRELGRGAMGVVYEGFDPLIARVVALKTIRADQLATEDAAGLVARFRNEAQAAGRLAHPNIVSIYDFGEDGGAWFIAMELVKGRELKERFDAGERFTTADTVRIMGQILAALGYSHRQGVVHRDVKPANIFLLPDGTVKVADFGIAHIESSNLTQVGTVLGTPNYMSPEQILGLPVDGRSDLFAAGVILYQFLTGERPFTGSATTTVQKVLKEDPLPPSSLNVQVMPAFDAVVRRALAKRPEERFADADEFAAALRAAATTGSATGADATMAFHANAQGITAADSTFAVKPAPSARTPPPTDSTPGTTTARTRRVPALALAAAFAAVAIGAGIWFAVAAPARRSGKSGHGAGRARHGRRRNRDIRAADAPRTERTAVLAAGHDADLRRRRDRSGRPALSQRRLGAPKRGAQGIAGPAGREGAGALHRHRVARPELRRDQRPPAVEERQLHHAGRSRERGAGGQGWPADGHDRGGGRRQGAAEGGESDVARRAHRVHPCARRSEDLGAHPGPDRQRAGRAVATVADRGEHHQGRDQVVRLSHVVGRRARRRQRGKATRISRSPARSPCASCRCASRRPGW